MWFFNTLRIEQNGQYCTDDIYKCINWMEIGVTWLKISNISVGIMSTLDWEMLLGDQPLSDPMLTQIYDAI